MVGGESLGCRASGEDAMGIAPHYETRRGGPDELRDESGPFGPPSGGGAWARGVLADVVMNDSAANARVSDRKSVLNEMGTPGGG